MPTEAQKRAIKKHLAKLEDLRVRVPKGRKAEIESHAQGRGESLNGFVNRAIDETIERDNLQTTKSQTEEADDIAKKE